MASDRISQEFTNVGTSFVTRAVTTPKQYKVIRMTVTIESGTGTTVAARLREKTDKYTRLEYGLKTSPIDSLEAADEIRIVTKERSSNNYQGTTYLAVKCDAGSDNTVSVEIDIETID